MNGLNVSKDVFKTMQPDEKLEVIFDNVSEIRKCQKCQINECEERFKNIENRKWKDKGVAGIAGLIGGFAAQIAKGLIK